MSAFFSYNFKKVKYPMGSVIYKEGDDATKVFIIKDGLVELY